MLELEASHALAVICCAARAPVASNVFLLAPLAPALEADGARALLEFPR